jgi:hypothetical protein
MRLERAVTTAPMAAMRNVYRDLRAAKKELTLAAA